MANYKGMVAALVLVFSVAFGCSQKELSTDKPTAEEETTLLAEPVVSKAEQRSFATQALDLSTDPPKCAAGYECDNVQVASTGSAIFRGDFSTWSLASVGAPLKLTLDLSGFASAVPVVMTMDIATSTVGGVPESAMNIKVNGENLVKAFADSMDTFHPVSWKIPRSLLTNSGDNSIELRLSREARTQYFIRRVSFSTFGEAPRLISENGKLSTDLYVQFGLANVAMPVNDDDTNPYQEIWTRAYSLYPPQPDPSNPKQWLPNEDIIPGPTMVYHPNDVLSINFVNNLNRTKSKWLADYEKSIQTGNPDDIDNHVGMEINIPHNADNTNLHTHGLHVDPRRDNVTLLIVPEDDTLSNYDTKLQELIPNRKGSQVPGGPEGNGDFWTWLYEYKIPADHLPGTHWYHAHKHGSTSTHVENGMAGTFVIRPEDETNTFAPGLWDDDADKSNDRVLVLQEIANYGIQQGKAGLGADSVQNIAQNTPDITVNGVHMPTMRLKKGQIERWRFVNAGANHRSSSYIWLGKKTGETVKDSVNKKIVDVPLYDSAIPKDDNSKTAQMYLVALDGVTLDSLVKITAEKPLLLAAGNRADVLVRIPEDGEYAIFKNFPNPLTKNTTSYPGGFTKLSPPAPMKSDSYDLKTNFNGFKVNWKPDADSKIQKNSAIVPLLGGQINSKNPNLVDVKLTNAGNAPLEGEGWQPVAAQGGGIDNQLLFYVDIVDEPAENGTIPTDLSKVNLSPYSPTGSAENLTYIEDGVAKKGKAPGYVSPIEDSSITTSPQVMVFDMAGVEFDYKGNKNASIKQFSLNGRQFDLNDFVGNPDAERLIQKEIPDSVKDHHNKFIGTYDYDALGSWTNQIAGLKDSAFWTNPGYYVPIAKADSGSYTYDYNSDALKAPSYDKVTGGVPPSQPVATTAQEWLLVNNSSVFHPFHIHISPFFVTEVGQLNYDDSAGWQTKYIYDDPYGTEPERQSWEVKVDSSAVDYVVGNWWDVIMIPPHGYIKLKTWFNVPWQDMENNIQENSNNVGTWVFHCHILRHEDRGMMMVVKTKKKEEQQ